MAAPIVEHYTQLKNETVSLFISHRKLILVSIVVSISLVLFGVWAMRLRGNILASMNSAQKDASSETYFATTPPISSLSAYTDILGTSNDTSPTEQEAITFPTPTPYPIITQIPLPTPTPVQFTTTTTAVTSCTGTPTVDNSQVYVSSSSTPVGSAVTITVDLMDCNNNYAPVSDSLTITLSSGDASTKINGSSSPVTIQTQNGKATFSVNSQNATTATFIITDTTRSFPVTMPGYHNPSVTFTNNNSGNSNCTTAAGVPNWWYSDVYPDPPISTNNGSITLIVDIRDCNQQPAPVSDTLNISVSSGNSDTQMNGGSLPQNVTTQNGEASFTISSQMNGTVTLNVQDTTSGFPVTDKYTNNPSITFSGSSTPTPTPAPASTDTPTPTPVATVTPTDTLTPTPTPSNTPTPTSPGP